MGYLPADISNILQTQPFAYNFPTGVIEHLVTDTRQTPPPLALFFAIRGQRHDGHQFLDEAYAKGIRHFVLSTLPALSTDFEGANIWIVPDTLQALQRISAYHRSQFNYPVVGITGSNGKTIVKEWLFQLLQPNFSIIRSPRSYNSQIGVPLSVWGMRAEHQLAIVEAGISQQEEMEHLARIIQPKVGILTNIGAAHQEGFPSQKEKLSEKMRLFDGVDHLIARADDPKIMAALTHWQQQHPDKKIWLWGKSEANLDGQEIAMWVDDLEPEADGQARSIRVSFDDGISIVTTLPFPDLASFENAMHALLAAYVLHRFLLTNTPLIPIDWGERLANLEPVAMRMSIKAGINRCTLVNDFYNNDIYALSIALQTAAQQALHRRRTLIISDILQSGLTPDTLYRQVANSLIDHQFNQVIGIGPAIRHLAHFLPTTIEQHWLPDTTTFLNEVNRFHFYDEVILIKGARQFEFERIARRLEQKAHKTTLEINLNALVHNLNVYVRQLRPGTRVMAMVKAAGYGSGAAEVGRLLEFHKIDYLGVAYADEGIELRQAGVKVPILVLNPEPSSFDAMWRYLLEPEVYSLAMLDDLLTYTGHEKALRIHLKLDTGMHRLGFEPADIEALTVVLRQYPQLEVATVFSHLAASDAATHDAFTHRQASAFCHMYEQLVESLGYRPLRHLVNTGGIVRFPEYHFDMVRLGIGLYGIDSSGLQDQLQVVNTLKATISQVKTVEKGETVGYNRNSGQLEQPKKIATISVGYADGLLRLAGGGRYSVLIQQQLCPTIGNVCMDMTMIDVSNIPHVAAGDEVIVFGANPTANDLAATLQTIPYEVFTNIAERVQRVYVQE
jgi:Alr-MurF fusion protein